MLMDSPNGQHFLNSLYEFPRTTTMLEHLSVFMQDRPTPKEPIHHVYELPSIDIAVRYLHGAAGFPKKRTWLKVIWKGNYLSWPLVNIKNVNKCFAEQEETQKFYMQGQRQGSDPRKLQRKIKRKRKTKMINLNRANTTSSSTSTTCHITYTAIRP